MLLYLEFPDLIDLIRIFNCPESVYLVDISVIV